MTEAKKDIPVDIALRRVRHLDVEIFELKNRIKEDIKKQAEYQYERDKLVRELEKEAGIKIKSPSQRELKSRAAKRAERPKRVSDMIRIVLSEISAGGMTSRDIIDALNVRWGDEEAINDHTARISLMRMKKPSTRHPSGELELDGTLWRLKS